MLNQKEKAHFDKQLTVTGLKKSDLLRCLIMGIDIQPKPTEEVIQIYRLCQERTPIMPFIIIM